MRFSALLWQNSGHSIRLFKRTMPRGPVRRFFHRLLPFFPSCLTPADFRGKNKKGVLLMRLFIALNFTNDVKARICEVIRRMEENAEQGRFVRDDQVHLTLEFLGEVPNGRVGAIRRAMDALDFEAFSLRLSKVGRFRRREGAIYWLGVEESDALLTLQRALHKNLLESGFKLEERDFTPHITLGRKVALRPGFDTGALSELVRGVEAEITKVDLMKSDFVPGGVKYTLLYSKPLRG